MEKIIEKAKVNKKIIVLPESEDIRTIDAAIEIKKLGIANIILIGKKEEIKNKFKEKNIEDLKFINQLNYEKIDEYVEKLYELRKNKGINVKQARELLKDPIYFATMMIKMEDADGMVAGAVNTTANTLRPSLQIIKTAKDSKMVSSVHVMCLQNKNFGYKGIMLYGDTALVENPNEEELADIAINSAKTFKKLIGQEPKVALLSYSTCGSANSEMTEKVRKAVKIAKNLAPEFDIDGEMQFDAATISEIGKYKAPNSNVAGSANVLIFPDLEAGNIAYKITERIGNAKAYGAITQGLTKPINDVSRGCSTKDLVGVVAITAVQAQEN